VCMVFVVWYVLDVRMFVGVCEMCLCCMCDDCVCDVSYISLVLVVWCVCGL